MNARWLPAFALLLAGCGEDAKAPDPRLEDPDGYFGLKVCTCYLYKTDGLDERLGVAVERTVDRGGGVITFELLYRSGTGQLFRKEYVRATDPDLLLMDVQYQGGAPSWRLDEGLPLVRWPPEDREGSPVNVVAAGLYRESATQQEGTPFQMTLRSDYGAAEDVTFQRGDAPETRKGVRTTYLLSSDVPEAPPWSLGAHTFVPEVGFVKLEQLDTGTGSGARIWELYAVKPLDPCPGVTQLCGFDLL